MNFAIALVLANVVWFVIQRNSEQRVAYLAPEPSREVSPANSDLVTLDPSTAPELPEIADNSEVPSETVSHGEDPSAETLSMPESAETKPVRPHRKTPVFKPRAPAEEVVESKPVMLCFEVGPYANRRQSEAVRRELSIIGGRVTYETRVRREAAGFWVFLPPERSAALGRLKVEEIKGKGLLDVVLVQKGEPKHAISLGVFKHKNTAAARLEQATALGYAAKMETWYTEDPQVWINVAFPEIVMNNVDWSKYVKGVDGVVYAPMDCPP